MPDLPEWMKGLPSGVAASLIAFAVASVLATAYRVARRRFLGERNRSPSTTAHRGLPRTHTFCRHGVFRGRQRLVTSSLVAAADIRRLGRLPLEYDYQQSRWRRLRAAVRAGTSRPSTPKPGFAVADWRVDLAADADLAPNRFSPGGFRLTIWIHDNENLKHLVRSLRKGPRAAAKPVVFSTPETLTSATRRSECYFVNAKETLRVHEDGRLTVWSSDPAKLALHNQLLIRVSDIPCFAVRLCKMNSPRIEMDPRRRLSRLVSHTVSASRACWTALCVSVRFIVLLARQNAVDPATMGAPVPAAIVWPIRLIQIGCLIVLAAALQSVRSLASAAYRLIRSESESPAARFPRYVLPAMSLVMIVVFRTSATPENEATTPLLEALDAAVRLLFVTPGILLAASHAWRYLLREFLRSGSWLSGTTRCLEDGQDIRGGYASMDQ